MVPPDEIEDTLVSRIDHGRLWIENDHWTMGIFSLDTWRRVLRETGSDVHEEHYHEGDEGYTVFT